jgi:hypothetical protein
MRYVPHVLAVAAVAALAGLAVCRLQRPAASVEAAPPDDRSDLRRVTDRTVVHGPTRVAFAIPDGWGETGQHPSERKIDRRATSVLRIAWPEREAAASLSWTRLNPGENVGDLVRDTPANGEYGEEYETLKAVYGRDQVTAPRRVEHGPFVVYRINYFIPDGGTRQVEGAVLLLPVDAGGVTWILHAHVTYPKSDRGRRDEYVRAVLGGYRLEAQ